MKYFSNIFAERRADVIEFENRNIYGIFRRLIHSGDSFRLKWKSSRKEPVQGIRLEIQKGTFFIAKQNVKSVVLWRDTAPNEEIVQCKCGKKGGELRIWNCWRDVIAGHNVTQAWGGNAGMLIEEPSPGHMIFRCNSRLEITFEDLIFELQFESGA